MLSDAEIIRRLRLIRHSSSSQRYAGLLPSISAIARETGVTRAALYKLLSTGSLGPSRARLSDALERCQPGHRVRGEARSTLIDAARGRF